MVGNESFFSKTLLSIITTSKAIQDVYKYVAVIDAKKKGGKAGVFATANLKEVFKNIAQVAALNSLSKKEASFISNSFLKTADKEWRALEPGGGLVDITKFVLGLLPVNVPAVFDKCLTKRDKNKSLSDSLQSKINSPTPPAPESLFFARLPASIPSLTPESLLPDSTAPSIAPLLPTLLPDSTAPSIASLLEQISYQQGRNESGEAQC